MKSYVNIASKSFGEGERLNALREKILTERGYELKKNPELEFRRNPGIQFNEWNLVEGNNDLSVKEEKNLYVSDWQLIISTKT
jgi:hypothetical protein